MLFSKPATTVKDQAQLLVSRGMLCPDLDAVESYLSTIGYYRLSAYWLPMEAPAQDGQTRSKRFLPGTSFDDVLKIYVFDRKLRLLVMEAIERIEISVRSLWTNKLTLAYGSHAHLDPSNFKDGWDHVRMLAKLGDTVGKSKETFIEHYRNKYTMPFMPPLWAVSETMTLTELSLWYASTASNDVRDSVARELNMLNKDVLEGMLQVLALIRNICAHHGRLWNRKLLKRVSNIKRLKADIVLEVPSPGSREQRQPENTIYNPLIVMLHMLKSQATDTSFPVRLKELLETATNAQREAMGLPTDWRTRPAWRLP